MLQFSDAPLRPRAQGYCGKYGALAGYRRYVWRGRISMWGGVLTFAVLSIRVITGCAPTQEKLLLQ